MKSSIDQYLIDLTDQLAFLNIEDEALVGFENTPPDFVIPIFALDIKKMAQTSDGFSTSQIASAILFLLGVDKDFRFKQEYLVFLKNAIDRPESFAAELGMQKYDKKSYKEALVYLRAAMLIDPEQKYPLFNYGQIALEFARDTKSKRLAEDLTAEAAIAFEAVLALDEKEPMANFQLGLIALEDRELDKATKHLEIANLYGDEELKEKSKILLMELDAESKLIEAELLIEEQQYEQASEILESIDEKGIYLTLRFQILFAKGFVLKALGQFEEAIEKYSAALEINNQEPLLLADLGVCFAYLGDFEQSLEFYLAVLEIEKDSAPLLNNIAIIYLNLKNIPKAKEYIAMAKELAMDDEIIDSTILKIRKMEEQQWMS